MPTGPPCPRVPVPAGTPGHAKTDVEGFVRAHYSPYEGDGAFLVGPTERTRRVWQVVFELLKKEQEVGVLDVDVSTPSAIDAFAPGYIDRDSEVCVGLQTDAPLKRSIKPKGGWRCVEAALQEYGFAADAAVKEVFTKHVRTHNAAVFAAYTEEMRACRSSHLLTGLPDAYARGRIIGDYRRVALYGVDPLVRCKKEDYRHYSGKSDEESMRTREEIALQIGALEELKAMALRYGHDIGGPARGLREAVQWTYFAYLAAVKDQDGAAMSFGRPDAFLDIYAERDLAAGVLTEEDVQELIDQLVIKMRVVRHLRPAAYNELFSGDPTWVTTCLGGMCEQPDGSLRHMVTKTAFRFLHTLRNLGCSPEPNLTVLWSSRLPLAFKRFAAQVSIDTSSIQYENDDLMRPRFGSDYAIACCVSAMKLGSHMQFFGARCNMPKLLLYVLNGGRDEISGKLVIPALADLPPLKVPLEYDEVLTRFRQAQRWLAERYVNTMNCIHYCHDRYNYEALEMALHDSDVHRLMAFGVAGLSVVADSLSAIRHASVTPVRDARGITVGFARQGDFPCFGNDDDRVDSIAAFVTTNFFEELKRTPAYRGAQHTLSLLTITSNVVYGKATGATPCGRLLGEPFAPGANPLHGRDVSGALASLASVAKLSYDACLDGISNTFSMVPNLLGPPAVRQDNLAIMLDGYFQKNGHHINVNVLSRETLLDAMDRPHLYPQLTIRVSGYAVHFVKLSREQQQDVLRRTMHGLPPAGSSPAPAPGRPAGAVGPAPSPPASDGAVSPTSSPTSSLGNACFTPPPDCDGDCGDVEDLPRPLDAAEACGAVGVVHSIETLSTCDGPGMRVLIFLQGCLKRCQYCHNPDMQPRAKAGTLYLTAAAAAALVQRYRVWLRPNQGGVTLSGGEPLLQPRYVAAVFAKVRALGLTTCLDTAAHGSRSDWDLVLPHTDTVLLCLKGMTPNSYRRVAGVAGLDAAMEFARCAAARGVAVVLRWVLLAGVTDTEAELAALAAFARTLPTFRYVELLPFHQLGQHKYEKLNKEYPLADAPSYGLAEAHRVADLLAGQEGVECRLMGDVIVQK
eukprot:EG_transcript_549